MIQEVILRDLTVLEYGDAWKLQESLLLENTHLKSIASKSGEKAITTHHLLFCEHPPVYTIGKSGKTEHVLISQDELAKRNIGYYLTNRGGDITFHGPGQLVGYPIIDLEYFFTDIGKYLRSLEEVIILTIGHYGIRGERSKGETGVWLDSTIPGKARKICAMGVRCSRWVTMHGFALNVNTDLTYFNSIIPCGIPNKQVTSLKQELGIEVDFSEVKALVRKNFECVFGCKVIDFQEV
ncbi:MAG: lipoyl(octanoyl) transferase [Chitinophagaceae bacterium]|nr:MAG: lipoyl(octanoyl) transferase [Chitinophagaceae bacterium]